ncbi:ubiquinol-cytochrome C reductase [Rahnella inusitata]|uniref:ubiquinol-cytochrome C reductase n=1 Tax=Rahnella inusitata TaxID=58169 RepID=UPI0039BEAF42
MRKDAYDLIDDCRGTELDKAKDMAVVAMDVHDSIIEGISAIGSVMFWAGDNENYGEDQAKRDMQKLGDMLVNISRIAAGAKTAEENLTYKMREAKQ